MASLTNLKMVFLGAGAMVEAIIRGLLQQQKMNPEQITAINRSNSEQLIVLHDRYNIGVSNTPGQIEGYLREADIVILAVKPKDVGQALAGFASLLRKDQLFISVVAGLSFSTIKQLVPGGMPVVRTMPNTSSAIGLGATGMSFCPETTSDHHALALEIFQSIGEVCIVEEALLGIVTGVSGSGPAYIYKMMDAMIQAGVKGGLTPEMSSQLTVQTVLGAAAMVKATLESPGELRRKVTSPNGTTQAAMEVMDKYYFSETVELAIIRAKERADELEIMISEQVSNCKPVN